MYFNPPTWKEMLPLVIFLGSIALGAWIQFFCELRRDRRAKTREGLGPELEE